MAPSRIGRILYCALYAIFLLLGSAFESNDTILRSPSSLTEPSFENLLDAFHSGRISKGLNSLKKSFPDYMARYVLMYHSESLQNATYQNPRAIVFGKTGQLIITFNGSKKQTAYAALETLAFDEALNYKLRTIIFREEPGAAEALKVLTADEIDHTLSTAKIIVSKPNPAICLTCHGDDPRPIRENYPIWAGVYGSDTDALFASNNQFRSLETFELAGIDKEKIQYELFEKSRPRHPRYSALLPLRTPFRNDDGEPRPNFVLDEIFAQQYSLRLRKALANVANAHLIQLLKDLLCFAPDFKVSSMESSIQREIWENEILNVTTALDFYGDSASRLELNGVAISDGNNVHHIRMRTDDPSWTKRSMIINEARTRYQRILGLIPNVDDFVAKAVAVVRSEPVGTDSVNERAFVAFRKLGIDLRDFTINRRRAPLLVTAGSVYSQFATELIAERSLMDANGNLHSVDQICKK